MNPIAIVGFGKIGQALAAFILRTGIPIIAIDLNKEIAEKFDQGEFHSNEPGLNELLIPAFKKGQLKISADYAQLKGVAAMIITIPLLVDQQRNLLDTSFIDCLKQLAPYCEQNTVIIIETSVPVGFVRNTILPTIESQGKKHGTDFLLAHSPERIKSGTMLHQLETIPKIIGGATAEATEQSFQLYQKFFPNQLLHKVESLEAAELVKMAGMIYRDVNIALSNQFAQLADLNGIPFADLIALINTDKEANLLQPGIGVGGHCTPVYPYFMIENFRQSGLDFTLAKESRAINDGMAAYAVSRIRDKVKKKKALILGLGFRPNVKEDAFSTTYLVNQALVKDGFEVCVHDPEFSNAEITERGLQPLEDIYQTDAELVFLITMHREYHQINFSKLAKAGVKFIVDGRNALSKEAIESAGIHYSGIGR